MSGKLNHIKFCMVLPLWQSPSSIHVTPCPHRTENNDTGTVWAFPTGAADKWVRFRRSCWRHIEWTSCTETHHSTETDASTLLKTQLQGSEVQYLVEAQLWKGLPFVGVFLKACIKLFFYGVTFTDAILNIYQYCQLRSKYQLQCYCN